MCYNVREVIPLLNYESLSAELSERILSDREKGIKNPYAADERRVIRRDPGRDKANVIRTAYIRDIDKIIHCPYYSRYADKTQVFSFYRNDDITRRALHVQLVSRIARTIGKALGLNLELTEAVALGHDIGHTPFGHAGEGFLDSILFERTGKHFSHNIHSVRVLDTVFPYNISLDTLCGIAAHDGEMELCEYRPKPLDNFDTFDSLICACYDDKNNIKKLIPSTLEGCVVRISDIIAYLGKDRQDALRTDTVTADVFTEGKIGSRNAEMINNLVVNIVENSYGKDYIKLDSEHFEALKKAKADNYAVIYRNEEVERDLKTVVKPMMEKLFEKLLSDLKAGDSASPVFTHHISLVNGAFYKRACPYCEEIPEMIVTDYIASMTDDYFIDLFSHLFPESKLKIEYRGYFDK